MVLFRDKTVVEKYFEKANNEIINSVNHDM